ncbi:MAG: three-Cys-motif partner protein TcmP [Rhodobiaceae bacterium]|nr:three-Cys-motif partner protein TcmP [Rhodobiaceae bacterium]
MHVFGGPWTQLKLDLVESYLSAWALVMKNQKFKRLYIDGFAGSGRWQPKAAELTEAMESDLLGELDSQPSSSGAEARDGSALRALAITPEFDGLVFIENNPQRAAELRGLDPSGKRRILIKEQDANSAIQQVCARPEWRKGHGAWRGVLFLDPYGNSVEWQTLEAIRDTGAIDVWYLLPLMGLYRNAARNSASITPDKRASITRILGTESWEADWYSSTGELDLFGEMRIPQREADVKQITVWVKNRLRALFPVVEGPKLLPESGAPMFALFFLMSSDSKNAQKRGRAIAGHILRAGNSS